MDNRKDPNTFNLKGDGVSTDALIGNIVQDLKPVRPYYPARIIVMAMLLSLASGWGILLFGESIRISFVELGAGGNLWNLRVVLAQVILLMASIMIVDLAVPRGNSVFERRFSRVVFFSLLGIFLVAFSISSFFADIPIGIKIKRNYCIEEGILTGLASAILVSTSLRRSLSPHRNLLLGALFMWTTFITVNVMDITCMVSISHSLRCHLLPILILGVPAVYLLGYRLKRF